MWPLSIINVLLIVVNVISALNKSESQLPAQSLTSHVLINQPQSSDHQSNQFSQVSHHLNQQPHFAGQLSNPHPITQFGQFGQQSAHHNSPNAHHNAQSALNQLSQLSQLNKFNQLNSQSNQQQLNQQQQTKEISCSDNQTISFIKYSNHKLSLNYLNKLTEFTVSKLLNQTSNSKTTTDRLRNSLNVSRSINQLCYENCKNDLECVAFAINLKQASCYLIKDDYKATGKDHLLFDTTSSWNFYEKICLNQGEF